MKKVFIDEYLTPQLRQQIDELVDLNLDLDSILSLLSNNLYDYADYMVEQIKRYVMYIMWLADNQKDRSLAFEKYKKRTNQIQAENNPAPKTKKNTQQNDNSWTIDRFLSQLHKDRKRIDELSTLKPNKAVGQKQNEKIAALEDKKDKIDEILETLSDEELQKTLTQILQDDKDLSQTMKEAISTQFLLTPDDPQKQDEIQPPTAEKTKAKIEPGETENQINEDKEDTVKPENQPSETDAELTIPDGDLENETNTSDDSKPQTAETINEDNETSKETDTENNQDSEETEIQEDEEDSDSAVDDQPVIDEEVNDEAETSDDSTINESEKKSGEAESQPSETDAELTTPVADSVSEAIINEDNEIVKETALQEIEKDVVVEELNETKKDTEIIQKDKIDEILDGLSDEEIQATLADILDNEEDLQKTIDETIQQLEANLASKGKNQEEENEDLPPTFSKKLADITFEDILSDPSIAKNRSTHTLFELDLEEDNGTQTLDDSLLFAENKSTKKPKEKPESPTQKELDFVDEIAKKYGTDTLITVNIKKHDLSTSDLSLAESLKTLKVGGIVWYKGREYVVEKIAMELDFFNHEQLMLTLNDLINHEEIKINAKKIK